MYCGPIHLRQVEAPELQSGGASLQARGKNLPRKWALALACHFGIMTIASSGVAWSSPLTSILAGATNAKAQTRGQ